MAWEQRDKKLTKRRKLRHNKRDKSMEELVKAARKRYEITPCRGC